MELLNLMKYRRSIRKYQDRQISRKDMETILVGVRSAELTEKIGRLNAACFDRLQLIGGHVSDKQPSIIDDPAIKNGFYGAPKKMGHSRKLYRPLFRNARILQGRISAAKTEEILSDQIDRMRC